MHYVLGPAYGRKYNSKKEVFTHFNQNLDFNHLSRLHTGGGTYINRAQIPKGASVEFRYGNNGEKSCIIYNYTGKDAK